MGALQAGGALRGTRERSTEASLGDPDHRPRFTSWLLQERLSGTTPPELTQQEVWAGRYEVRDGPEVRLA